MHHAYYIEGPIADFEAYRALLKPFWAKEFESFGIDEARELIQLASLKNFNDSLFLIAAPAITSEAQQALLKLFEEPQEGTTFVLMIPHGALIGTLRSRMLPYPKKIDAQKTSLTASKKFLSDSIKARSANIATLLKDDEGVRERVRGFLDGLEVEMYAALSKTKEKKFILTGLEDISKVRSYVGDRSPSLKMLLEHLAITLPKV